MLTFDMKNMKARNMEELSNNLKEIADSIRDGYTCNCCITAKNVLAY